MNEKPLERLNYYNGMPLQASDFKTEQDYHMRTRRWLNKSLYSAGIARGLEVREITEGPKIDTPYVAVSPGLALDSEGREIILFDEALVEVCSYSGTNESTVVGNYLVIEYAEETLAYESGGCAVRTPGTSASKSTNQWGGPSRIQARVKFSWVAFVPHPGSNQIVLARVELKQPGCGEVHQIDAGARRYIGAASVANVRQYALEGEKEVAYIPSESFPTYKAGEVGPPENVNIVGRVYFHIRGRQPSSVTLYLKAEEISPLHYTELATHKHGLSISGNTAYPSPELRGEKTAHKHKISDAGTTTSSHIFSDDTNAANRIKLKSRKGYVGHNPSQVNGGAAFFLIERDFGVRIGLRTDYPVTTGDVPTDLFNAALNVTNTGLNLASGLAPAPETDADVVDILGPTNGAIYGGDHAHTVHGTTESKDNLDSTLDLTHTHGLSGTGQSEFTGNQDILTNQGRVTRIGKPFTYFYGLQIAIDGVDRTRPIIDQIIDSVAGDAQKDAWEQKLGNGTSNHPLANEEVEAVPIRLDFLPHVAFGEGRHVIEFSVRLTPAGKANGGKIHYNLYIE